MAIVSQAAELPGADTLEGVQRQHTRCHLSAAGSWSCSKQHTRP